jgi:hypothetical protein
MADTDAPAIHTVTRTITYRGTIEQLRSQFFADDGSPRGLSEGTHTLATEITIRSEGWPQELDADFLRAYQLRVPPPSVQD